MSLLPQQKKSAEEIAKLRESLGIAASPPSEEPSPVEPSIPTALVAPPEAKPAALTPQTPPASSLAPLPVVAGHAAKPVRSLKRSERIPVLPVEDAVEIDKIASALEAPPSPSEPALPKPVRSLRKSEQGPSAPSSHLEPPPDSPLPVHRHSDHELQEIRRKEALAMLAPAVHPQSLTAHLAVIIPGYLLALCGAVGYYYYELQIQVTAACVAAALLVAAFIFVKKPLSRHHAAFIAVASLFVMVFGALYYFPQLRHGT